VTTFRSAVEAGDVDAVAALLADDVVFVSPVAFKPYPGKAITTAILRAVVQVFEDFHYVREIGDPQGGDHVLVFEAAVDGLAVTGADFLRYDAQGRITELMVMVRPLRAAEALAARMGARFEQIQAEALAAGS
jgi:ketosteroid isomerase-like protein